MSKTQGKHIQKENVLRRAYNNTSLSVKILCVVMSFLLVALLIPLGGLKTVRSWAEENIPGVAASADSTTTDTSTTADTTATQSTDTSTSTNSATDTSTSTSTTTNSNNQLTSNDGQHLVVDQDGNQSYLNDTDYAKLTANAETTIDFSDIGDYYIKNPTYNEPQTYYYPDATFKMVGFKGNQGEDNYCSLQYDSTLTTDKSWNGWHTRSSSENMSRGSYLEFTPNANVTQLVIPAYANKADDTDHPQLFICTDPSNPTGSKIAGPIDLTSTSAATSVKLDFTTIYSATTKYLPAGTTIYIYANDTDGGNSLSNYLTYGGASLQQFTITTTDTSRGIIGSIAPTKTATTATVKIKKGDTVVKTVTGINTSTTDAVNFAVQDVTTSDSQYTYEITADGYDTVTGNVGSGAFSSSTNIGQITLNFSPLNIGGTINTKTNQTPIVQFYQSLGNDTYSETPISATVTSPSSNKSKFNFTDSSSKGLIPGGASGLLYVYEKSDSSDKYYLEIYYIENLLSSINSMDISFSATSAQSSYTVTIDDLVLATRSVEVYDASGATGTYKTLAIPSGTKVLGGSEIGISARSGNTASQEISAIYDDGSTEIITGNTYTVSSDVTIKVTNPNYTWYKDNQATTSSTEFTVSELSTSQVICNGRYSYLVDGLTKTYTEPAVATYRITASPTNLTKGSVTFTAVFVTVDTSGNKLFATQTKTFPIKETSESSHTITENDGHTYTFNYPLTNDNLVKVTSGSSTYYALPSSDTWYLTEDLEVSASSVLAASAVLRIDLNGHQIKMTRDKVDLFTVTSGSSEDDAPTLSIHDSQAGMSSYRHYFTEYSSSQVNRLEATDDITNYYIDGGVITGCVTSTTTSYKYVTSTKGHVIYVEGYGNATIFGGAIVGNYGPAIYSHGSNTENSSSYNEDGMPSSVTINGKQISSSSYCGSQYSVLFAGNYYGGSVDKGFSSALGCVQTKVDVTNATFYANASNSGGNSRENTGGAVATRYCAGTSAKAYDGVRFTNVDFYNNKCSGKGGAWFIDFCMETYVKNINCKKNECSYGITSESVYAWGGGIAVNCNPSSATAVTTSLLVFDGTINVTENTNVAPYYKNKNVINSVATAVSDNISLERKYFDAKTVTSVNAYIRVLDGYNATASHVGVNSLRYAESNASIDLGPFTARIVDLSAITDKESKYSSLITGFTEDQTLNIKHTGSLSTNSTNYSIVVRTGYDSSEISSSEYMYDFFVVSHTDKYLYTTQHTSTYNGYSGNDDTCTVSVEQHDNDSFSYSETTTISTTDRWGRTTTSTVIAPPFYEGYYYQCKYSLNPLSVVADATSADAVYDGQYHPITVQNIYEAQDQGLLKLDSTVYYQKQSDGTYSQIKGEPKDAGTYYAEVTLKVHTYDTSGNIQEYNGTKKIYSKEYIISPRLVKLYVIGETREFNGTGYCTDMASYMVESLSTSTGALDPDTGLVEGESLQVTADETNGIKSKLDSYGKTSEIEGITYTYNEYATLKSDGSTRPTSTTTAIAFASGDAAENTGYVVTGRGTTNADNYKITEYEGEQEITPYQQNPYLVEKTVAAGVQTLELNPQTTYNWFDKGKTVPWEPTSYVQHTSTSDPKLTFTPVNINSKGDDGHYTALTDAEIKEQFGDDFKLEYKYDNLAEGERAGARLTTTEGYVANLYLEVSWKGLDFNNDGVDEYASDYEPYTDTSSVSSDLNRSQVVVIHLVNGNTPQLSLEAVSDPAEGSNVYAGRQINYGFKVTNNSDQAATTNDIIVHEYNGWTVTNIGNAKYTSVLQPGESCYIGCNSDGTPTGEFYYTVQASDEENGKVERVFYASTQYGDATSPIISNRDTITHVYKGEPISIGKQDATYDGTVKTGISTSAASTCYLLSDDSVTTATEAGTYTFKATPKDGYIWSDTSTFEQRTFKWTISKRDVTIKLNDASYTYDGTEQTFASISDITSTTLTSGKLVPGQYVDSWTAVNQDGTTSATQTNVGTWSNFGINTKTVVIKDTSGNTTTDNYNISTSYGATLTINQLTIPVTITATTEDSFTYKGSAWTDNSFTISVDDTYKAAPFSIDTTGFSPLYKGGTVPSTVNILPSDAINVGTYTTQIGTNYESSLTYAYADTQAAKNYCFSYTFVEKEFQIVAKSINDTKDKVGENCKSGWIEYDYSAVKYVYDGNTKSLVPSNLVVTHKIMSGTTEKPVGTLVIGTASTTTSYDLLVTQNHSEVNAGVYQEYATGKGNYTDTRSFNWEITTRPLNLTVSNNGTTYTYDNTDHSLIAKFEENTSTSGLVSGSTGEVTAWTITSSSTWDAGNVLHDVGSITGQASKWTITNASGDNTTDNYNVNVTAGTITVEAANIGGDSFEAVAGIGTYKAAEQNAFELENFTPSTVYAYDGSGFNTPYNTTASKNAGVAAKAGTTLATQGTTLTYGKDYVYDSGDVTGTNANTYTVKVKAATDSNYTGTCTITWTIQQAYFYYMASANTTQKELQDKSATTFQYTYDSSSTSNTGSVTYYSSVDTSASKILPKGQSFVATNETHLCSNPTATTPTVGDPTINLGYYCDAARCASSYNNGIWSGISSNTSLKIYDSGKNDITSNYNVIPPTVAQRINDSSEIKIDVDGLQRTFEYDGTTHKVNTCTEKSGTEETKYSLLNSSSITLLSAANDSCTVSYNYNANAYISGTEAGTYSTLTDPTEGTVTFAGITNYKFDSSKDTATKNSNNDYYTWKLHPGNFTVEYTDNAGTLGKTGTEWPSDASLSINVVRAPQLTISQKAITISPDTTQDSSSSHVTTTPTTTKSQTYNRSALTFDTEEYSVNDLVTYDGDQHSLTIGWNSYTGVKDYTQGNYVTYKGSDLFDSTQTKIMGTDAEHSSEYDLTKNYAITYADGGLKVDQRDISLSPAGKDETGKYVVTIDSSDLSYDGTSKEPAASKYTVTGKIITGGSDDTLTNSATVTEYKITNTKQAAAGKYTATITGYGNFKGTITGEWSIAKRAITVSPVDASYTYDGTAKELTSAKVSSGTLVDGHNLSAYTFTPVTKSSWPTDAVTNFEGKVTDSSVVIKDNSGNVLTSNYNITYGSGYLTINKRDITPDPDDDGSNYFTLSLTSPYYNGKTQNTTPTVTWYKKANGVTTSTELKYGTDYTWKEGTTSSAKDHNTSGNTYLAEIVGAGNFSASSGLSGTWDIKQLKATVTPVVNMTTKATSKEWTYDADSDPYTLVMFTYTDGDGKTHDGLVESEGNGTGNYTDATGYTVTFSDSNNRIAATDGTVNVTATVNKLATKGNTVASGNTTPTTNYSWTSSAATIKINKVDISDDAYWSATGGEYTYNGSAYTINASTFTTDDESEDWKITGKLGDGSTHTLTSGEFTLDTTDTDTYTYTATDANKYDGAPTYKVKIVGSGSFSGTREVTWKIAPKAATVTFTSATYPYDNQTHYIYDSESGFVDGHNITIKKYYSGTSVVTNSLKNVGKVTIDDVDLLIMKGSSTIALTNYDVDVTPGTLEITAIDINNGNYKATNAVTYYNGGQQNAFNITYTAENDETDPNKSATVVRTGGAGTLATSLVYGTDFTCAQADKTDAQEASALTIVGTGNYTGTLSTKPTYTIKKSTLKIYAYEATSYSDVEGKTTYSVDFSSNNTGSSADRQETWQSGASTTTNNFNWKAYLSVNLKTCQTNGTTPTNAAGYYTDDKHTSATGRTGTAVGVVKLYTDSTMATETTSNYNISYEYHMIIRSNEGIKIVLTTDQITKTYDGSTSTISISKGATAESKDWGITRTGYSAPTLTSANIKYIGSGVNLSLTEAGSKTQELTQGALTATDSTKAIWKNADFQITFTETTQSISSVELEVVSPTITINKKALTITPWTENTKSKVAGTEKYSEYNGTTLHFDTNEFKTEGLVSGYSQTTQDSSHKATWNTNGEKGAADVNTIKTFTEEDYSNPNGAKAKPRVISVTVWGKDAANSTAADLTANYNITYAYGSYKMDPITDADKIIKSVNENNVYDGSTKYANLQLSAKVGDSTVKLYSGTDYVIASGSITENTQSHLTNSKYATYGYEIMLNSGSNGNYDFTELGSIYWKINPRPITVTGETISVEYDGFSHSVKNATFTYDTSNASLNKHTFTCTKFNRQSGETDPFDVTENPVKYTPQLTAGCITLNGSSVDLNNFEPTYVDGSVTITACDLSKHYVLTATGVTYNGYEQRPTVKVTRIATDTDCAESLKVLNGPDSEDPQYTWNDATGYTNIAKDWQSGGYTCAVKGVDNFSSTGILTAAWAVNRLNATVTPVSNTSYIYNGTAQGLTDVKFTYTDVNGNVHDGLVADEDIKHDSASSYVTFNNNSLTNAGTQQVTATVNKLLEYDGKTETKATNYIWKQNEGTLTVNPRSLAKGYDGVTGGDGMFEGTIKAITYDGLLHTITDASFGTTTDANNKVVGKLIEGGSDVYIVGGTDFNVSGGTTKATNVNVDSSGNVVNYSLTVTGKGNYTDTITINWQITKRTVTATLTDVIVDYDSFEHKLANPTYTGVAAGQTMVPSAWKVYKTGEKTDRDPEGNEVQGNSRTNAGLSWLTVSAATFTYNGTVVSSNNYILECNDAILQVKPIKIDGGDDSKGHVMTLTSGVTTYNGSEQQAYSTDAPFAGNAGYSHTTPNANYTYTYTDAHGSTSTYTYDLVKDVDYTVVNENLLKQTNADTYDFDVTGKYSQQVDAAYKSSGKKSGTGFSNFDGTATMSWTINKMPIWWWGWAWRAYKNISDDCAQYNFDSETSSRNDVWWASPIGHSNGIYQGDADLRINGQLPEGAKFTLTTYSVTFEDEKTKQVGYYTDRGYASQATQALNGYVDFKDIVFTEGSSNTVSNNYVIENKIATITINNGESLAVNVTGDQNTVTYDGTAHAAKITGSSTGASKGGWSASLSPESSFNEGTEDTNVKLGTYTGDYSYVQYNSTTDYTGASGTDVGTYSGDLKSASGFIEFEGTDPLGRDRTDQYWINWWQEEDRSTWKTEQPSFILSMNFDKANYDVLEQIGTMKYVTINVSNPAVVIKARDVDVTPTYTYGTTTSSTKVQTYNGSTLQFTNDEVTFGSQSGDTGIISGQNAKVTNWDSNNALTNVYDAGAEWAEDPIHAGTYYSKKTTYPTAATVKSGTDDVSKNYNFKFKAGILHLDQADISDGNYSITVAKGLTYNVEEQGGFTTTASVTTMHKVSTTRNSTTVYLDYKGGVDGDFVVQSGDATATAAGDEYEFTIKGQRNYTGTLTSSKWAIAKAPVTVTGDDASYVYDTTAHTLTSSTFTFSDELKNKLSGSCTTFTPSGGTTNVTTGDGVEYTPNTDEVVISVTGTTTPLDNDNFTFIPKAGHLKITARQISTENGFTFTATGGTYKAEAQDATPKVTYSYTAADGTTVSDDLTLGTDYKWEDSGTTYTHNQTDVSATNYTARIVGLGNYAPTSTTSSRMTADWNIIPKPVTVVPQDTETFTYDGQKHYVTELKFQFDGEDEQDTLLDDQIVTPTDPTNANCAVTYVNNAGITNVNDANNTAKVVEVSAINTIYKSDGVTPVPSRNYKVSSTKAKVTVQARHIDDPNPDPNPPTGKEYVASASDIATTYNGLNQTLTGTTKGNDGKAIAVTATLVNGGSAVTLTSGTDYTVCDFTGETTVGNDTAPVKKYDCTNPAKDAGTYYVKIEGTGNYTGNIVAKWTIVPAELTVYITGVSATTGYIKGVTQSANALAGSTYGYTVSVAEDNSLSSEFNEEYLKYNSSEVLMDTTGEAVDTYTTDLTGVQEKCNARFSYEDNNLKIVPVAVPGTLTITSKPVDDPTPDNPTPDPGPVPTPDPNPNITSWIAGTAGSVVFNGSNYDVTDEDSVGSDNVMKIYQYYKTNVTSTGYDIARNELTLGTDYEILTDSSKSITKATNVGDYTVTIKGIGNYSSVKEAVVTWHITRATLTVDLKGKVAEYEYDAKEHTVTGADLMYNGSTSAAIFSQSGVYAKASQPSASATDVAYDAAGNVIYQYSDALSSDPSEYFGFNSDNIKSVTWNVIREVGVMITPRTNPDTYTGDFVGSERTKTYDNYTYKIENSEVKIYDNGIKHQLTDDEFEMTSGNTGKDAWQEGQTKDYRTYTITFKGKGNYSNATFYSVNSGTTQTPLGVDWYITKRSIADDTTYVNLTSPLLRYTGQPQTQGIDKITLAGMHDTDADTSAVNTYQQQSSLQAAYADSNVSTTRRIEVTSDQYIANDTTATEPGWYMMTISGQHNYKDDTTRWFPVIDKDTPVDPNTGDAMYEFKVRDTDAGFTPTSVSNTDVEVLKMAGNLDDLSDMYAKTQMTEPTSGNFYGLYLDVSDATNSIKADDKSAFEQKLASANQTLYQYLDVSLNSELTLYNTVGGQPTVTTRNITQLNQSGDALNITMAVPSAYVDKVNGSASGLMNIYRIHDGALEDVDFSYDASNNTISFSADKFSSYAFAYDSNAASAATGGAQTGDKIPVALIAVIVAVLVAAAAGAGVVYYRKRNGKAAAPKGKHGDK